MLSKYTFAIPIKRKTGDSISQKHSSPFSEKELPKTNPKTDHGTEFINKKTQNLFKSHNIEWFETYNETKAQIVERFNKS